GAYQALHSDLTIARQPWKEAGGSFGDPRLDALAYAVLAPNPHNRQPWLIRLDGTDALTLFCDLDRLLPETDPPNRQITIGLGAFLELLRQAAAQNGYRLEVTPFPEGEPQPTLDERPVAHVAFVQDTEVIKDSLFGAALDRRTSRLPFDQERSVSAQALNRLDAALHADGGEFEWVNDASNIAALKNICLEGWRIEAATPHTHEESVKLMRFGEKEINENPDGISLSGPLMEGMRATGIMTREKMKDHSSRAYQGGMDYYNGLINSAMAFGWISTGGNTRADQLNTGASWIRLQLAATRDGLAMHPLSQVLQEFPEMAEIFEEIHDFTGVRAPANNIDGRVQGLFRFGYAKSQGPAPRWLLSSRIIAADDS
ncbi:MAG: twin-arginine translocation pathway signal protein, partial [Alphaproteobacteria bacterium]|nr:twin-arginine translocation pathway signal protein [Alphaproteobacteria bacterium]